MSETVKGGTARHARDLRQFNNRWAEMAFNIRHSCWMQIALLLAMIGCLGAGYWLFLWESEYNPDQVGGHECDFSGDDARMTTGELILQQKGRGSESVMVDLPAGDYELAYRYRPWSDATGDFMISIRTPDIAEDRLAERDFFQQREGIRWHAGRETFRSTGTRYEIKVAYPPQPWCFELAKQR